MPLVSPEHLLYQIQLMDDLRDRLGPLRWDVDQLADEECKSELTSHLNFMAGSLREARGRLAFQLEHPMQG